MWFDPTAIAQRSPSPATSATSATLDASSRVLLAKVAEVAKVATPLSRGNETTSYGWLIHFRDRDPLEVAFSPTATHDKVLASYPSALAAEPIEAGRRQPDTLMTGKQETAFVAWLAQIGESDETIIDDVLTLCRQDDDARAYYLGRAGADPQIKDDRRFCTECSNLRAGVCIVARPGGVVSAIRGYRPALVNVPVRCAGYSPNADDTDQRPSHERWPGLSNYPKGAK